MTLAELAEAAAQDHLAVFGAFHTSAGDPGGDGTMILFGPLEPGFWDHVTRAPEWKDGDRDPMDRWSRRVIVALSERFAGTAFLPFGQPVHPFMSWAIRSGRAWSSPVHLLVHDTAGLMVSYRGALHVTARLTLPGVGKRPCESCETRACLTACPVAALTSEGYDLETCHAFLDTPSGGNCMTKGCEARRACPISQSYGRMEVQSAFHMERFHP